MPTKLQDYGISENMADLPKYKGIRQLILSNSHGSQLASLDPMPLELL